MSLSITYYKSGENKNVIDYTVPDNINLMKVYNATASFSYTDGITSSLDNVARLLKQMNLSNFSGSLSGSFTGYLDGTYSGSIDGITPESISGIAASKEDSRLNIFYTGSVIGATLDGSCSGSFNKITSTGSILRADIDCTNPGCFRMEFTLELKDGSIYKYPQDSTVQYEVIESIH